MAVQKIVVGILDSRTKWVLESLVLNAWSTITVSAWPRGILPKWRNWQVWMLLKSLASEIFGILFHVLQRVVVSAQLAMVFHAQCFETNGGTLALHQQVVVAITFSMQMFEDKTEVVQPQGVYREVICECRQSSIKQRTLYPYGWEPLVVCLPVVDCQNLVDAKISLRDWQSWKRRRRKCLRLKSKSSRVKKLRIGCCSSISTCHLNLFFSIPEEDLLLVVVGGIVISPIPQLFFQ